MKNQLLLEKKLQKKIEETQAKLNIAKRALMEISIWSQGLQDEIEKNNAGISMWRGCVAAADQALEKINP